MLKAVIVLAIVLVIVLFIVIHRFFFLKGIDTFRISQLSSKVEQERASNAQKIKEELTVMNLEKKTESQLISIRLELLKTDSDLKEILPQLLNNL